MSANTSCLLSARSNSDCAACLGFIKHHSCNVLYPLVNSPTKNKTPSLYVYVDGTKDSKVNGTRTPANTSIHRTTGAHKSDYAAFGGQFPNSGGLMTSYAATITIS